MVYPVYHMGNFEFDQTQLKEPGHVIEIGNARSLIPELFVAIQAWPKLWVVLSSKEKDMSMTSPHDDSSWWLITTHNESWSHHDSPWLTPKCQMSSAFSRAQREKAQAGDLP